MGYKSFQDEFGEEYGEKEVKHKTSIRAFLPIFGLLLFVALAAVSFVLSEPLTTVLRDNIDNIPADESVQYVVGGITFLVLLLMTGFMYALFAPKPQKRVTEADLKKERTMKAKEKEMAKRRRLAMAKKEQIRQARERKKQE